MKTDRKNHWETIYGTKNPEDVSWTQETPKIALDFLHAFELEKSARIIDVGGGDSKLVDHLLDEGFGNVTVLDISAKALEKAKKRLGDKASKVSWIVSDITEFNPETTYDVWHDRAVFHFLTSEEDVNAYKSITEKAVNKFLILGTFSEAGPTKCSGLEIKQYTDTSLASVFKNNFDKIACKTVDHTTPSGATQNFLFCSFKKRKN